jgi:hypothetical protein
MKELKSFLKGDLLGVHLAVNIFIATTALWLLLRLGADTNPIWAISAMIPALDPQMKQAVTNFRGRIFNALLGCATGLLFLLVGGTREWKLPLALSATVLLSSCVVRIPATGRQAPITAAIIIAAGLTHHSKLSGVEIGLRRVGEVILGDGFACCLAHVQNLASAGNGKQRRGPLLEGDRSQHGHVP